RVHDRFGLSDAGEDDNRKHRIHLPEILQHLETAHAGHHNVEDEQGWNMARCYASQSLVSRLQAFDEITARGQKVREVAAHAAIVINNKDRSFRHVQTFLLILKDVAFVTSAYAMTIPMREAGLHFLTTDGHK